VEIGVQDILIVEMTRILEEAQGFEKVYISLPARDPCTTRRSPGWDPRVARYHVEQVIP